MSDVTLARELAAEAGALLMAIRAEGGSGRALGDRGDREANALLLDRLRLGRPGDAVLSEESVDDLARLEARRVWIIDPLDGTREYAEGRDDWAVHVALAIDGIPAVGAVALPAVNRVLASDGATVRGPLHAPLRIVVSRTRAPEVAARVAAAISAELVPMGSAGAKAMAVVEGRAEVYLHAGGQYEWDNCAPVAVALAAGLVATRLDGSPIVYNRRDTLVPDLLICRAEIAADLRRAIDAA